MASKVHMLRTEQVLHAPLDKVFAFFANAGNLERVTPPWVCFRILTPLPIDMRVGALIDYRIKLGWLPMRWTSEITAWEPPYRFQDVQQRGPYKLWEHTHTFREIPEGVLMTDEVRYQIYGGFLGEWLRRLWVAKDLDRIFAYRNEQIPQLVQELASSTASPAQHNRASTHKP